MFIIKSFAPKPLRWWFHQRGNIDFKFHYRFKDRNWTKEEKAYLIDSILNGYDLPKIYIADFTYKNTPLNVHENYYGIIDGKNRFESIFDFFDGNLVLSEGFKYNVKPSLKLAGLSYKDLEFQYPDLANRYDSFVLSVMSVITDDKDKINELFSRLNSTKSLSGTEVRGFGLSSLPKWPSSSITNEKPGLGLPGLKHQHRNKPLLLSSSITNEKIGLGLMGLENQRKERK
ncbi:MAG: DUF262 domain-containing protein [Nitrospirae bacterium]|nr:DUF262 domain-containing protein [Nitrospirota bacterium]